MSSTTDVLKMFPIGSMVRYGTLSQAEYEVAEVTRFHHGIMVGIYDEPPSRHVDFVDPRSLTLSKPAPAPKDQPHA